jgi:hypothetical protein
MCCIRTSVFWSDHDRPRLRPRPRGRSPLATHATAIGAAADCMANHDRSHDRGLHMQCSALQRGTWSCPSTFYIPRMGRTIHARLGDPELRHWPLPCNGAHECTVLEFTQINIPYLLISWLRQCSGLVRRASRGSEPANHNRTSAGHYRAKVAPY